jgi:hypothetical protein
MTAESVTAARDRVNERQEKEGGAREETEEPGGARGATSSVAGVSSSATRAGGQEITSVATGGAVIHRDAPVLSEATDSGACVRWQQGAAATA